MHSMQMWFFSLSWTYHKPNLARSKAAVAVRNQLLDIGRGRWTWKELLADAYCKDVIRVRLDPDFILVIRNALGPQDQGHQVCTAEEWSRYWTTRGRRLKVAQVVRRIQWRLEGGRGIDPLAGQCIHPLREPHWGHFGPVDWTSPSRVGGALDEVERGWYADYFAYVRYAVAEMRARAYEREEVGSGVHGAGYWSGEAMDRSSSLN